MTRITSLASKSFILNLHFYNYDGMETLNFLGFMIFLIIESTFKNSLYEIIFIIFSLSKILIIYFWIFR